MFCIASAVAPTLTRNLTISRDPEAAATQISGTFLRVKEFSFIVGTVAFGFTLAGISV